MFGNLNAKTLANPGFQVKEQFSSPIVELPPYHCQPFKSYC